MIEREILVYIRRKRRLKILELFLYIVTFLYIFQKIITSETIREILTSLKLSDLYLLLSINLGIIIINFLKGSYQAIYENKIVIHGKSSEYWMLFVNKISSKFKKNNCNKSHDEGQIYPFVKKIQKQKKLMFKLLKEFETKANTIDDNELICLHESLINKLKQERDLASRIFLTKLQSIVEKIVRSR